jgi:hypothetical protein
VAVGKVVAAVPADAPNPITEASTRVAAARNVGMRDLGMKILVTSGEEVTQETTLVPICNQEKGKRQFGGLHVDHGRAAHECSHGAAMGK